MRIGFNHADDLACVHEQKIRYMCNNLPRACRLWLFALMFLPSVAGICAVGTEAQQVEPSLPTSQRFTINLAAGVPEYVADATSTSNDPQSHWWFQNTNNSTTYSSPSFVESSDTAATWKQVGLPYDANIPRTFINQVSGGGEDPGNFNWYRLHFKVDPKYAGQKFLLNLEGSHTGVQVFINGTLLPGISAVAANSQATHVVGFIPVQVDLTPYIKADGTTDNVIAIDVSRGANWYEQPGFCGAFRFGQDMAGLFRNVYLYVTNPVHIPLNVYSNTKTWGTYVGTVSEVPAAEGTATAASAVVNVQTNVLNESTTAQQVTLTTQIVDQKGNVVVTAPPITQSVPAMTAATFPTGPAPMFNQSITVQNPTLWYPNNSTYGTPYMYKVYSIVSVNGVVVDSYQSPLGIRTLTWDANFPYFNGHSMHLWGGASRYDYPALGSSVPDEVWWRDLAQFAASGGNVWRPGHCTQSEEFVDAADAYGVMIDQPSGDGEGHWNATSNPSADDLQLKQELHRDMIIRDRSHPSILDWEADNGGNNTPLADALMALSTTWDNIAPRVQADRGYNPAWGYMAECDGAGCETAMKGSNQNNPAFGAEYWDNIGTGRGTVISLGGVSVSAYDYELAFAAPYIDDWRQGRVANTFGMAQWYFADTPGEISTWAEFQNQPLMVNQQNDANGIDNALVRSLGYSMVDQNRFPRLLYYIYQANWVPYALKPVVHLAHHWNRAYEYTPGTPLQVNAFSNCPAVRLLINGVAKDPVTGQALADQTPNPWEINSHNDLTQNTTVIPGQVHWMVNWAAGSATAECLGEDGTPVSGASHTLTTAGTESQIVLTVLPEVQRPDGTSFQWTANGSDAAFVQAEVEDAQGNWVPTAMDNVTFTVTGTGGIYMGGTQQLVAVPQWTNYYQDAFSKLHANDIANLPYGFFHAPGDPELNFEGGLQKIALRSTFTPGSVTVTASAPGLGTSNTVTLTSVAPPLPPQTQPPAIIVPPVDEATTVGYPATFTVSASGGGTLTYQWYENGSAVGTNSSTYTTPATTLDENGANVTVTVSSSYGSVTSNPVTLTVAAAANVAITTQPAAQSVIVGQSATLTVAATGSPALNYAWYENGALVQSGPLASYTTPILTATGTETFYVIVSNPVGQQQSNNAVLTIAAPTPVSIVTQPPATIAVPNNQPVQISAVVAGSAPYTYQWNFTPAGGAATILAASTQSSPTISYVIPQFSSANVGAYTVTVNNAAAAAVTSNAANLTLAPPGVNLALNKTATSSSSQNACTNGTTTPPFTGAGCLGAENAVDGDLTNTRWGSATAGAPPTPPVAGVDPSWLQVDLGSPQSFNTIIIYWENAYAAQYAIQYTNGDPTVESNWQTAFSNPNGTGKIDQESFPTVQGRYIRVLGQLRSGNYGYSIYEFQVYNVAQCGGATERYTVSSTSPSLVTDNTSGLTWTRTIETDTTPGSQFTGVSAANYCSSIAMRVPTASEALSIGGNSDATCAFPGVWSTWTSTVDPNDPTRTAIVNYDGTQAYQATVNYPGATLCDSGTAPPEAPVILTQPQSATVAVGQTATFTVAAAGSPAPTYQWSRNAAAIAGATTASYTTPATVATDNGTLYSVTVTNTIGSATSSNATLNVTASAPAPDFTLAVSPATITVTPGATATGTVTLTPENGFSSGSTVALACTGLPTGATCSFSPATVNTAGNIVSTLTVTTTTASAAIRSRSGLWFPGSMLAAALCFFGRKRRRCFQLMLLAVGMFGLALLTSCGGTSSVGPSPTSPQPVTSTVTVTATSGSLQHTTTFSLTIQSATAYAVPTAPHSKPGPLFPSSALAGVFCFLGRKRRRGVQLLLAVSLTCIGALSGCGGSSSGTPPTSTPQSAAPTITTQPASQTVAVGQAATFSVVASGTAPLTYQWQSNGTAISGATAASYTTPAAVAANNGTGYNVVVTNSVGSVTSSTAVLSVTTSSCGTVPAAPNGLTATASSSTAIGLGWTAVTPPTNCTIGSYSIYRNTTSGFTPSSGNLIASGLTSPAYSDTSLLPSTTYYYVVEAVDAAGASAPSAQASAITQASGSTEIVAIASGGPAQSNANGGDFSFVADEYGAGGGNNGAVTSTIDLSQPGANAAPMGVYQNGRVGVSTYTIPGLAAGAQYNVLLHFAETYFTTAGSRQFNVAINGTPVLTNLDVYATVGADAALVKQFAATANASGQIVLAFTNGASNAPLIMGIEVRGIPSSCTLVPAAPPTGLTATASSPSIVGLSWATVAPPPNCTITYNLYGSKTSGFTPSAATLIATGLASPTYSNTGLAASTTYYYAVEAVDAAGASAPSAQASAETNSANSCAAIPPSPPSDLAATASSSSTIGLNWTAVTPQANCSNITYNLYRSTTNGFAPSGSNEIAVGLTGTSFVNNALPPSTTYYYAVQAVDEDGPSASVSSQVSATTLTPETTLTAVAVSANEIDLSWPASTAAAPVTYTVFRSAAPAFTPSSSNQIGATKSNWFQDVLATAATTYYYKVEASGPSGTSAPAGPVYATTLSLGSNPPFWDASNMPSPAAGDVMVFKFLNRTNGRYTDDQITWSATINGVTTTNTVASQPTFSMPANPAGRMYFYLGNVGQGNTDYYDFIEYTIGTTGTAGVYFFNGDTTRVDAFGVKLAMQLTCGDGTNIAVGENAAAFAENRATTFQHYIDAVPADFQPEATLTAPYRILEPGGGGFNAGGPYQDYYTGYIADIWSFNGITIPMAGPNGSGLTANPALSASIYRHTAPTSGTPEFDAAGNLTDPAMWGNPSAFYRTEPTDHYAKFWHANAINGQQYAFPYDDSGGYSSDVSCNSPKTLLVVIGW